MDYEQIRRVAAYLHADIKQHHIALYHNGRVYIRAGAVKRYGLKSGMYATVINRPQQHTALIRFSLTGNRNRLRSPYKGALYFYSKRMVTDSGMRTSGVRKIRLRILWGPVKDEGNIYIEVSFTPVKDLWELYRTGEDGSL